MKTDIHGCDKKIRTYSCDKKMKVSDCALTEKYLKHCET